jgi:hypothetical protein
MPRKSGFGTFFPNTGEVVWRIVFTDKHLVTSLALLVAPLPKFLVVKKIEII